MTTVFQFFGAVLTSKGYSFKNIFSFATSHLKILIKEIFQRKAGKVSLYLKHGNDFCGTKPLFEAVRVGNTQIVKMLLDAKFSVD